MSLSDVPCWLRVSDRRGAGVGGRLVGVKWDSPEVRALLASGMTQTQIGAVLGVSKRSVEKAVRTRRARVRAKTAL